MEQMLGSKEIHSKEQDCETVILIAKLTDLSKVVGDNQFRSISSLRIG